MKSLKNLLSLGVAAALGIATFASTASAEAPSDVKEIKAIQDRGVLRVGVKNDVVGFSVKDPLSGEYTGFEDTLATLIAKGNRVLIQGELHINSYKKDEQYKSFTSVSANLIEIIDYTNNEEVPNFDEVDTDVPF